MNKLTNQTAALLAVVCLTLLSPVSVAQEKRLINDDRKPAYEDWYGDVKKTLADHYTGKTVKLRMAIPSTRRGLEMFDGAFEAKAEPVSTASLANPGDDLTIKSFKVRDHEIELLLSKNGEQRRSRFFGWPSKKPRINLRFSRELTSKDMTIENINRWLSPAVDVSVLSAEISEPPTNQTQASVSPSTEPAKVPLAKGSLENSQGLPMAVVTGDLPPTGSQASLAFAELTIECQAGQARVYIDEAYSGFAPRTVRLRSGIHSILVMANGRAPWEQRLFIPGGKVSVVKAEPTR